MAVMVETPLYSGPAEILLKLVAEKEIDIWELSLSVLVKRYLEELESIEVLNLNDATELLMIAAILVEIKSRGLLPKEEEETQDDLPDGVFDSLIAKMLECKTFKAVSLVFEEMALVASRSTPRRYGLDSRFLELLPDLLVNVTPTDLKNAYMNAVVPKKAPVYDMRHISPITRTVPETVDTVIAALDLTGEMTFRELTSDEDRIGIVFCFLAVLELYKRGMIDILQAQNFGEIQIKWIYDET